MTTIVFEFLLAAAIVTGGLLAGVFFAFTCAVTPALRRVDDRTYVTGFRAVNAAILNGWFLGVYFAAPVAAVASASMGAWLRSASESSWWLVCGAVCSALTFLITTAANVPLNRRLDRAPVVTGAEHHEARRRFETAWNRWNLLRTLTSIGALACLAVAAVAG